ncbi:MAG: hypothetical protein QM820_03520 [Minicystis sp.]
MPSVSVEVVIRSIRRESEAIIVDMTLDGVPQQFRFSRPREGIEYWAPGNGRPPFPYRSEPRFVATFGSSKGRREITDLIIRWDLEEPMEFPVQLTTTRRA